MRTELLHAERLWCSKESHISHGKSRVKFIRDFLLLATISRIRCLINDDLTMRKLLLILLYACTLSVCAQESDSIPNDTLNPDLTFVSDTSKWSFTFNYGMGPGFYRLQTQEYSALKECRAHHDRFENGVNFGVNVNYELSDRFELVSGFSFFQTGFSSTESMQLSDTLDMEFVLGCEIGFITDPKYGYIGNGFWDYRYAYVINGLHPAKADLFVQLHYSYFQVPLMLKTNFGKKRSRVFFAFGAGMNHMMKVKHKIVVSDNLYYIMMYVNDQHQPYYRRWNVSVLGTIGAEHKMTKQFSIGLNVAGTYQYLAVLNLSMVYHLNDSNP
jgi:hypothetical protein